MQSNIVRKLPLTSIRSTTGQIIQVRNHVKIYPWRFNRSNSESYLDTTKTPYTDRFNINEFRPSKKEKKPWQIVIPKDKDNRFNSYKWHEAYESDPVEAKETAQSRLARFQDSIRNRGAARESKPYDPPENVESRILALFRTSFLSQSDETNDRSSTLSSSASDDEILNMDLNTSRSFKFSLITQCIAEFDHDMPSSYLNDLNSIRDLVEYFSTPVRGVNPYNAMLKQGQSSLPENLSLISDAHRFDVETDQYFDGYNALPGIICKVPGLRGSKLYPILNQDEFQWPDI